MIRIKACTDPDVGALNAIEQDADARFAAIGMGFVVDCPPASRETLSDAAASGRLVVARDDNGDETRQVGFVFVEVIDGRCHVEQISVHPDAAGQGVGTLLLEWAEDWGRTRGFAEASMRTYADVPWNAPWYLRRGWRVLPDADLGPGLLALIADERSHGLDAAPRVVLVKPL